MAAGPLPVFDVNRSTCLKKPRNQSPPQRGTRQFLDYMAEHDDSLPSYWNRRRWTNKNQRGLLVNVGPKVLSGITDSIVQTWQPELVGLGRDARGLATCDIEVVSVKRFEAPWLYGKYLEERKELFTQCKDKGRSCPDIKRLPGSTGRVESTELLPHFMKRELYWEVNEHYLYHGTRAENVQSILFSGLDPSFSSPSGMFGQAIYTSESFTKADQYTDSQEARSEPGTDLYMILARVLLGRVFVCTSRDGIFASVNKSNGFDDYLSETQDLHWAPCTRCHVGSCNCRSPSRYDSIMADGDWMFREFAVHYSDSCYPE